MVPNATVQRALSASVPWRERRFSLWAVKVVATLLLSISTSLALAQASQGAGKRERQDAAYIDAVMGHVHLRIPRDHLFFGVTRPGENWLDPNSRSTSADPREIDSFDLLLWPDMQPIRAGADRARWENDRKTIRRNSDTREVVVMVETVRNKELSTATAQKKRLAEIVREKIRSRDLAASEDVDSGLIKWSPRSDANAQMWENDVFHDDEYTSVITCGSPGRRVSNPLQVCRQIFMVDGYPFWVSARYTIEYLPNWRNLRDHITKMIGSFVVESQAR